MDGKLVDEYCRWKLVDLTINYLYQFTDIKMRYKVNNLISQFTLNFNNGFADPTSIYQYLDSSAYKGYINIPEGFKLPSFEIPRIKANPWIYKGDNFGDVRYADYKFRLPTYRIKKLLSLADRKHLLAMCMRYSSVVSFGGNFYSMGDNLYNEYVAPTNPTLECFSSPLNNRLDRFCSLFPDVDYPYGSIGDFFKVIDTMEDGSYSVNPPFTTEIMDVAIPKIIDLLDRSQSIATIYVPQWEDAYFMSVLNNSKYLKQKIVLPIGHTMKDMIKDKEFAARAACYLFILSSKQDN